MRTEVQTNYIFKCPKTTISTRNKLVNIKIYLCTASESAEWHLGFINALITCKNWSLPCELFSVPTQSSKKKKVNGIFNPCNTIKQLYEKLLRKPGPSQNDTKPTHAKETCPTFSENKKETCPTL